MTAKYDVENSVTGEITEMEFEDQRTANGFFMQPENSHLSRVRLKSWEIRNATTGEIKEIRMRDFDALKKWLSENQEWNTYISTPPAFTGDHITAVKKHDSGFKEVLQKIHSRAPGSVLNKTSSQI